jgi:adenylylsulfate kinase
MLFMACSELMHDGTEMPSMIITPGMRALSLKQKPCCIWLTGLSGAGKSTIANALEVELYQLGKHTLVLDGDNVRKGLSRDLGMAADDRRENIRRVGEAAKLMVDAGLIVICALISPYRADRALVRSLFTREQFIEVFINTPLDECERRDPKGLYRKARLGEIIEFTGLDSPYESPERPELTLDTTGKELSDCVGSIFEFMKLKFL